MCRLVPCFKLSFYSNLNLKIDIVLHFTARQILSLFCLLFLVSGISLLLAGDLKYVFPISLILQVLGSLLFIWKSPNHRIYIIVSWIAFFVVFMLMSFISSKLYDFSFDGMRAHQPAILALKTGWNPFSDPLFEEGKILVDDHPELKGNFLIGNGYKINCYYLICASIYRFLGNIEAAKAINMLLLIASIGVGCRFFSRREQSNPLFYACLLALNPVVLYQAFDFTLDGFSYSLFLILLFSLTEVLEHKRWGSLIELFCAASLLPFVKLSGIAYCGAILMGAFLLFSFNWIRKQKYSGRYTLVFFGFLFVVFSTAFLSKDFLSQLSIHDYSIESITQKLSQRDYSRPGFAGIEELKQQNKIQRFFYTHFSETHISPGEYRLKMPGKITSAEVGQLYHGYTEYRTGGFGPLFSLTFILSILLLLRSGINKNGIILLSLYGLSSFILFLSIPVWWARWASYLWLLPLLPVVFSKTTIGKNKLFSLRGNSWLLRLNLFVLTFNILLISVLNISGKIQQSMKLSSWIDEWVDEGKCVRIYTHWFPSNALWFYAKGIEVDLTLMADDDMNTLEGKQGFPKTSSKFELYSK